MVNALVLRRPGEAHDFLPLLTAGTVNRKEPVDRGCSSSAAPYAEVILATGVSKCLMSGERGREPFFVP